MLCLIALATGSAVLYGQGQKKLFIEGVLKDQQNTKAVAFASVALRKTSDSTFITGVASNNDGEFRLENIEKGSYCIRVSALGYDNVDKTINIKDNHDMGIILLQQKSISLAEVVVAADRMKARAETDKTTYFINKKMYDASNNGIDMLSYIPGVQVDIMKNISFEGSQRIVILVDGKERDRNFLSQLNANKIDKVEVSNAPGAKYDADVTGVINIILKEDKASGIDGHFHLEVPTSEREIYVFPDYSFNYGFGKGNVYTSYNGDLSYFNIVENSYRNIRNPEGIAEITSDQLIRQKYWSHRFHLGMDYDFNGKNKLNLYAFGNPFSSEHSGNVAMRVTGDRFSDQNWSALKRDEDINFSTFYTINYKHIFDRPGREITFDLSYFNFKAVNSTTYITTNSIGDNYPATQINKVKPDQNSASLKIDYTSPLTEKLKVDAGVKLKSQLLKDRLSDQFKYDENIFSLYGVVTYSHLKLTLITGLRAERSTTGLINSFNNKLLALLPNATISYKLTSKQNIKLSYNRTIYRPNIYELNPFAASNDPYSLQSGNSDLKPEFQQNLSLDFSKSIENSYISFRLYYLNRSDAINYYTFINEDGVFETRIANLGEIHGYGIQMAGALRLHKAIAINPFFKVTGIFTASNNLAKQYDINSRRKIAFESGLTSIVNFKYDIVASLTFQYNSPLIQIQTVSFSDAMYIISLEKSFKQKLKVGLSSALPFAGSFTYHGTEIKGSDFYSYADGNIRLSAIPLWLKLTYTFNPGKVIKQFSGNKEDLDNMPKKGF